MSSAIVAESVIEVSHKQNEMKEFPEAFGLLQGFTGVEKG
jgi:hypothetical protein